MFKPIMNFVERVLGGERKRPAQTEPHREKFEIPMPESPVLFGVKTPGRQEKYDAKKSPFYGFFKRGAPVAVIGVGKKTAGKIVGYGVVRAEHPTKGVLLGSGWRQPRRLGPCR
ncbi:MAG: hypothetical protein HZA25_02225 [Candidatus Niyogibacteria bacterium]|nr:hypothetical protein [Candidatus Niyogibacteria bacterium]